jgi:hypothetical protein
MGECMMETTITNIKWLVMIGTLMQVLLNLWWLSQMYIYLSWVFALCVFFFISFAAQRAVVETEKLKWSPSEHTTCCGIEKLTTTGCGLRRTRLKPLSRLLVFYHIWA